MVKYMTVDVLGLAEKSGIKLSAYNIECVHRYVAREQVGERLILQDYLVRSGSEVVLKNKNNGDQ